MIERWFAVEIDRHMGFEHLDITRDLFANYNLTSFIQPNYDNGITTYFRKTSRIDYPGLDGFYQHIINCATNLAVHQGMDPLMYKLE